MKKTQYVSLLLILAVLVGMLCVNVSAVSGSDYCYHYTPQMTENTFRYLNEIYIEKYPQAALRFEEGTQQDRQDLQHLANIITQGCATDSEKASAIASWIKRNIEYSEGSTNFYAADVFYAREGNCASYAQLMQALLRLLDIPAVWGDGFAMDTQAVTVEQMQNLSEGHAWCFAYVDGRWALYDPLWEGGTAVTDRDYIARNYFLDTVDQIVPAYDLQNLPPFRDDALAYVYADGRFWVMEDRVVSTRKGFGGGAVTVNMTGAYYFTRCGYVANDPAGSDGYEYISDPARKEQMQVGELYRDGWVRYGTLGLSYKYENGVAANGVVKELDGVTYFQQFDTAHRLLTDEYYIEDSWLHVQPGYEGKIFEPSWYSQYKDDEEYEIIWSSEDPDIATVDQNGNITSTGKEGGAVIWITLRWKAGAGYQARISLEVIFKETDRVADFSDHHVHEHSYTEQIVPPTCLNDGYTLKTCTCGETYSYDAVPALGHTFGKWQTVREATQQQPGLQERFCSRCGERQEQEISYTPPEHVCDYQLEQVIEPTCEYAGYTVYVCSCGNVKYEDEVPAFGAHQFGPWEVAEMPTADKDGVEIRECTLCGQLEMRYIPAGTDVPEGGGCEHNWVYKQTVNPTCEEAGFEIYSCPMCGKEKYEDIDALGHDFGEWEVVCEPQEDQNGYRIRTCSVCGAVEEEEIPAPGGNTGALSPEEETVHGDNDISLWIPDGEKVDEITLESVTVDGEAADDAQQALTEQLGELERFWLLDISMQVDGQIVQPDRTVVVFIPIRSGWNTDRLRVYHITEDMDVVDMQASVSEDGTHIIFETDHFSYYAVVQMAGENEDVDPPVNEPENNDETQPSGKEPQNNGGDNEMVLIVVAVVAAALGAGAAIVIPKIKRKK